MRAASRPGTANGLANAPAILSPCTFGSFADFVEKAAFNYRILHHGRWCDLSIFEQFLAQNDSAVSIHVPME